MPAPVMRHLAPRGKVKWTASVLLRDTTDLVRLLQARQVYLDRVEEDTDARGMVEALSVLCLMPATTGWAEVESCVLTNGRHLRVSKPCDS